MRRSIHIDRHLRAEPAELFEVLVDHARYDRFDGIRRAEVVRTGSPDPNGVGAVRHVFIGPLRFEEEITAYEPGRRFDYLIRDVRGLPFSHEGGSVRLEPDGAGTRATWTSSFEIPIPIVGSVADRIFSSKLERGFNRMLERSAEIANDPDAAPA
jgi:uncharacterized protein YndB with AHSA1/START domain